MKVRLEITRDSLWLDPLRTPEFKQAIHDEFDVNWDCEGNCDIMITDQPHRNIPRILLDFKDSPMTRDWFRNEVHEPAVSLLLKPYQLRSVQLENSPQYDGSYEGALVYAAADPHQYPSGKPKPMLPEISPAGYAKLTSVLPTIWNAIFQHDHLTKWFPTTGRKQIDVCCLISSKSYWAWHVRYHRHCAITAVRNLPPEIKTISGVADGMRNNLNMPNRFEHFHLMQNSKIVVSPWGYGEVSTRDIEAILAGCVVIKPPMDHLLVAPDLYQIGAICYCEPAFHDLADHVRKVLDDWSNWKQKAEQGIESLKELQRHPRHLAQRIAAILQQHNAYQSQV